MFVYNRALYWKHHKQSREIDLRGGTFIVLEAIL